MGRFGVWSVGLAAGSACGGCCWAVLGAGWVNAAGVMMVYWMVHPLPVLVSMNWSTTITARLPSSWSLWVGACWTVASHCLWVMGSSKSQVSPLNGAEMGTGKLTGAGSMAGSPPCCTSPVYSTQVKYLPERRAVVVVVVVVVAAARAAVVILLIIPRKGFKL